MAHIIIPQPDTNKYMIFSTVTDSILVRDYTKEEIIEYEKEEASRIAKREARERTEREFDRLLTKHPRVSYKEAIEYDRDYSRK